MKKLTQYFTSGFLGQQRSNIKKNISRIWAAFLDDGSRISLVGALIMAMTGLFGILGAFMLLEPQIKVALKANLELSLKCRVDNIQNAIREVLQTSIAFSQHPLRIKAMEKLGSIPADPVALLSLSDSVENFRALGFSAIGFYDHSGHKILQLGRFLSHPEIEVPLKTTPASSLLWENGYILDVNVAMVRGGEVIGFMRAERPLPVLDVQSMPSAKLRISQCVPGRIPYRLIVSRSSPTIGMC